MWRKVKTKTINGHVAPKRDVHVARGARVLTTGISIASVLGLTSAYAIAAQHSAVALVNDPTTVLPDINQLVAPPVIALVIAPSQPAPATPALAPVATTPPTSAPKVTRTINIKAPRNKQTATKSGGSK